MQTYGTVGNFSVIFFKDVAAVVGLIVFMRFVFIEEF